MKQIQTSEYKYVYILGTKWTIVIVNDKNSKEYNDAQLSQVDGRCMKYMSIIYVKGPSLMYEMIDGAGVARYKHVLRHEILHAFMASSGLRCCTLKTSSWSNNEEMIDFFAEQLPKIFDVYKELGILRNNELEV